MATKTDKKVHYIESWISQYYLNVTWQSCDSKFHNLTIPSSYPEARRDEVGWRHSELTSCRSPGRVVTFNNVFKSFNYLHFLTLSPVLRSHTITSSRAGAIASNFFPPLSRFSNSRAPVLRLQTMPCEPAGT